MEKDDLLKPEALMEEAKASKHGEAYKTLDSGLSYRIGIGARLKSSENYSFFVEILVYLCPASGNLDLETLGKCLACLKELEKRGYSLTCQDGECISCETTVSSERLAEEYATAKSLIEENFC
ncbi:MAG: hypothetical protein QW385_02020 [Thermoproteota archaeon]